MERIEKEKKRSSFFYYLVAHKYEDYVVGTVVTSNRKHLMLDELDGEKVRVKECNSEVLKLIKGRWPLKWLELFLEGKEVIPISKIFLGIRSVLDKLIDVKEIYKDIIALWIIATYCYKKFDKFPYIYITGLKGSGKSTILDCIAEMAYNSIKSGNISPAALYNLLDNVDMTLLLDEMEVMSPDLLSILNVGYSRTGGIVLRKDKVYPVYSPKVIAAIETIPPTVYDRSIVLHTFPSSSPIKETIENYKKQTRLLRSCMYSYFLLNIGLVDEKKTTLDLPDFLLGRDRDVWKPLLVIASLVDDDNAELNLSSMLVDYISEYIDSKKSVDDFAYYTIKLLESKIPEDKDGVLVNPTDIYNELISIIEEPISIKSVGSLLNKFQFKEKRTEKRRYYFITRSQIIELKQRYRIKD